MQYRQGHAEVQAEGFSDSASFSIMASGKAFRSLIDGLYSRKIEAAVRELSTNAFDSHNAADNPAPFQVHLPTTLDPVFWIRDFGTGMSHDLVMKRYKTLFDSTKDGLCAEDSGVAANRQVGMLGLGSKSFFAYTDSCTLSVWQNGEARHYSVFMGAGDIPTIALAARHPSDEPTGVRVEFAAQTRDFAEFERSAIRVFKGFPYVPEGLPPHVTEAISAKPIAEDDCWKIFEKDYLPESNCYARQGCVLYPIDLSILASAPLDEEDDEDEDDESGTVTISDDLLSPETMKAFRSISSVVVIDFPIGSIEFDISRERLAYTPETIAELRAGWVKFVSSASVQCDKAFANCKTDWEIMTKAGEQFFNNYGPLFQLSSFAKTARQVRERAFAMFPKLSSDRVTSFFSVLIRQGTRIRNRRHNSHSFKATDFAKCILVYPDQRRKKVSSPLMFVEAYITAHKIPNAFMINPEMFTLAAYRQLGSPPIMRLSEMEDCVERLPAYRRSVMSGGGGGCFSRMKVMHHYAHGMSGFNAVGDDIDLDDCFYGFINRGSVVFPENQPHRYDNDTVSLMVRMIELITDQKVVFVNTRSNESFDRWDALPKFYDEFPKVFDQIDRSIVRKFVDVINHKRYSSSNVSYAVNRLIGEGSFYRWKDTPLAAFHRFETRWEQLSKDDRKLFDRIINGEGKRGPIGDLFEAFMNRALEEGFYLLPPVNPSKSRFVSPVLSKHWMKIVHDINQFSLDKYYAMIRSKASC